MPNDSPTVIFSGPTPTLLLDSGTHGDEAEIIPFIEEALRRYRKRLPPYVYVREVSPSAIRLESRKNKEGVDVNRDFFDDSPSREVQSLIRALRQHRFTLGVSFHMDLTNDAFYFYDSGDMLKDPVLVSFQSRLEELRVPLLTGVDDPSDPVLGDTFIRGYPAHPPSKMSSDDGTMWTWLLANDITRRLLMPEVPGEIPQTQKKFIIDAMFTHVIIPLSDQ